MSLEFETTSPYICCNIQFCIFMYLFPIGYDTLHLRVRRYKLINEHIIMQHIVGQLLCICSLFASQGLQQQGRFEMLN
jgi:hypothetical protein